MKNKKGQTLVLFIIFLPVIIISFAFVIDVGLMYNAKIKGENLLKEAEKENIDIVKYFSDNGIEIKEIKTDKCTKINYEISSIFGRVLGMDTYKVEINNC